MSPEAWQVIAAAIVALSQVYATRSDTALTFAKMWDILARVFGTLANMLANLSMQARINYFEAVNAYGS